MFRQVAFADFDSLLEAARLDGRVVGMVLTGSRGRGVFVHPASDWDVRLVEAHLDAVESVSPLLTTLFAVQGRLRPFNKFLRWELENFPLDGDVWSAQALLPRLQTIVATGDLGEQERLFRDVEETVRKLGFGEVVDGWEPDVAWLRGERLASDG